MMKILALTRYHRNGPSSRLRTFQYLPHLLSSGMSVQVEPLLESAYIHHLFTTGKRSFSALCRGYLKRIHRLCRLKEFDLLWFEKELFPWLPGIDNWLLAKNKIPYVVDYDDATFHLYDRHRQQIVRTVLGKKLDAIMRHASTVIVGNTYLAERAKKSGAKRIQIIPTVVDTQRYKTRESVGLDFAIGWIGTPVTEKYLEGIRAILETLSRDKKIKIVLVGASKNALRGLSPEIVQWTEASEVKSVQSFSVGIMPLLDNPFERGKCGYKLIQCMACGVPVVASPVGVNQSIITHGENGFLAQTLNEWMHYLILLRNHHKMRYDMGNKARATIRDHYSLSRTAPLLAHTLSESVQDGVHM